jgi:hypothetical protein
MGKKQKKLSAAEENLLVLFHAASEGRTDIIKAVAEKGTPISHARTEDGATALHVACRAGRIDCVRALLNLKCDVLICDNEKMTPYQVALEASAECVQAFHQEFFQRVAMNAGDGVVELASAGVDVNCDDGTPACERPLHWAASFGHEHVVSRLITAGANIDVRNSDGATPLHEAAHNGHVDVTKLLLEHKADTSFRGSGGYSAGKTAAECANKPDVKAVIEKATATSVAEDVTGVDGEQDFYRDDTGEEEQEDRKEEGGGDGAQREHAEEWGEDEEEEKEDDEEQQDDDKEEWSEPLISAPRIPHGQSTVNTTANITLTEFDCLEHQSAHRQNGRPDQYPTQYSGKRGGHVGMNERGHPRHNEQINGNVSGEIHNGIHDGQIIAARAKENARRWRDTQMKKLQDHSRTQSQSQTLALLNTRARAWIHIHQQGTPARRTRGKALRRVKYIVFPGCVKSPLFVDLVPVVAPQVASGTNNAGANDGTDRGHGVSMGAMLLQFRPDPAGDGRPTTAQLSMVEENDTLESINGQIVGHLPFSGIITTLNLARWPLVLGFASRAAEEDAASKTLFDAVGTTSTDTTSQSHTHQNHDTNGFGNRATAEIEGPGNETQRRQTSAILHEKDQQGGVSRSHLHRHPSKGGDTVRKRDDRISTRSTSEVLPTSNHPSSVPLAKPRVSYWWSLFSCGRFGEDEASMRSGPDRLSLPEREGWHHFQS